MTDLIERLEWLATYLRNEDLVYNDKAFGLRDELKKAADRLRKLEAVREDAADRIEWHKAETTRLLAEKEIAVFFLKALVGGKFKPEYRIFEEADKTLKALADCGDES